MLVAVEVMLLDADDIVDSLCDAVSAILDHSRSSLVSLTLTPWYEGRCTAGMPELTSLLLFDVDKCLSELTGYRDCCKDRCEACARTPWYDSLELCDREQPLNHEPSFGLVNWSSNTLS